MSPAVPEPRVSKAKAPTNPGFAPVPRRLTLLESRERRAERKLPAPMAATLEPGLRLAFAGGGTGGHIVPGLHLLAHLQGTLALSNLLWFQTGRRVEARVLAGLEERLAPVPSEQVVLRLEPEGGGAPGLGRLALRALPETLRARRAMKRHGTEVLLGLGGFTSLPAVLAAKSLGIPVALLEVNAAPGRATRTLAPLARRVFHAWRGTMPQGSSGTSRDRWTGPPLSTRYLGGAPGEDERRNAREHLGVAEGAPLLVVLGGSQGAGGLNDFVGKNAAAWSALGIEVLHQVGPGRSNEGAEAQAGYRAVEYIDDVRGALAAADFVLCRGGASTLAEVGASCRAAWVVPYPHHADRHQALNARELGDGVKIVEESELDGTRADEIGALLQSSGAEERAAMERALAGRVPCDAAVRLCEELLALARPRTPGPS